MENNARSSAVVVAQFSPPRQRMPKGHETVLDETEQDYQLVKSSPIIFRRKLAERAIRTATTTSSQDGAALKSSSPCLVPTDTRSIPSTNDRDTTQVREQKTANNYRGTGKSLFWIQRRNNKHRYR
jgi:hypothetical protein